MRQVITRGYLIMLLSLDAGTSMAQCFPDSSASWCFRSLDNSEIVNTHMVMGPDPDTAILGRTYKRIEVYNDAMGFETWQVVKRYYVRSDTTGKGYVMLLDSMQEYLAVDVSALEGDTIQNVLTVDSWEGNSQYDLKSVYVDSVVVLTNNGVSVVRQYVHAHGWEPPFPVSYEIFWQAGIGGSYGPLLMLTVAGSFQELRCLRTQDTYVYYTDYPGLPGIPCDCPLDGPLEAGDLPYPRLVLVSPNPSTGLFNLDTRLRSATVYDALGMRLFETNSPRLNLSDYPPGLYMVLVLGLTGRQAVRLVVER